MPTRQNVNDSMAVTTSLVPLVRAATAAGTSVDTRTHEHGSRYLAIVSVGTLTDGGYTPVVEDSDDDSSFATLAPFDGAFVEVTTSNDPLTQLVSFVPVSTRPFVRISITETTAGAAGGESAAYIVQVPSNL